MMTGVNSQHLVEVDGVQRHVRDIRLRAKVPCDEGSDRHYAMDEEVEPQGTTVPTMNFPLCFLQKMAHHVLPYLRWVISRRLLSYLLLAFIREETSSFCMLCKTMAFPYCKGCSGTGDARFGQLITLQVKN